MAYKQLISFNQSAAGKKAGYCLQNTRKGFGIGSKYDPAWQAWLNSDKRTDAIPEGLDVPVFFSYFATINGVYKNWGHVGVRLKNGKFWSDGKVYDSIAAYQSTHKPNYVGWSDDLNGVSVLQYVEEPKPSPSTGGGKHPYAWAVGKSVFLKPVPTWRVYKPGTRTVIGTLLPGKFGGLTYTIRGVDPVMTNSVLVHSGEFGKYGVNGLVRLPLDGDAVIR